MSLVTRIGKTLAQDRDEILREVSTRFLLQPSQEPVYREVLTRDPSRLGIVDEFYPSEGRQTMASST